MSVKASGCFHLINPSSKHRTAVRRYLTCYPQFNHHWVRRALHPSHLETMVEWAINEGFRTLVVWGGDGSINRVVQWLAKVNLLQEITLAFVPVGTCNDLARMLVYPSWKKCAQMFLSPSFPTRLIDVGFVEMEASRRYFVNNCGFGRTSSAASKAGKSNLIKDIFQLSEKRLNMEWADHGHHRFETLSGLMMVICNGAFFNGGLHFSKNASVDDGTLNAYVVLPMSRARLMANLVLGRVGISLSSHRVMTMDAQWLHIHSDLPLHVQVDGELAFLRAGDELKIGVSHKALRISDCSVKGNKA